MKRLPTVMIRSFAILAITNTVFLQGDGGQANAASVERLAQQGCPMKRGGQHNVRYIVFEGGGAAGAAYVGALIALMDPAVSILRYKSDGRLDATSIKGLAGSSSGAVTAALVASGYRPEDIDDFVSNSARLFDDPLPRQLPFVPSSGDQRRSRNGCLPAPQERFSLMKGKAFTLDRDAQILRTLVRPFIGDRKERTEPHRFLSEWPATALWLFAEDYGVFPGCKARTVVDAMIGLKTSAPGKSLAQNITFAQHLAVHKVKLVLAGTDLETGNWRVLSAANDTKDFAVADAVRIAMGFPLIFKPVVIPSGTHEGTWVDSGVIMNFPLHAFAGSVADGEKVLGLRLRRSKREKFVGPFGAFGYLWALASIRYEAGMLGPAATRASNEIIVEVDAEDIGVFDVVPDRLALQKAVRSAIQSVMVCFTGQTSLSAGYAPRWSKYIQ